MMNLHKQGTRPKQAKSNQMSRNSNRSNSTLLHKTTLDNEVVASDIASIQTVGSKIDHFFNLKNK